MEFISASDLRANANYRQLTAEALASARTPNRGERQDCLALAQVFATLAVLQKLEEIEQKLSPIVAQSY